MAEALQGKIDVYVARWEKMSGATLARIHRRMCCQQCQSLIVAWFGNYLESNLEVALRFARTSRIQSELGIEHSAELTAELEALQQRVGTGFLQQVRKLLQECAKEAVAHAVKNWVQSSGQQTAVAQLLGQQQKTVCVLAPITVNQSFMCSFVQGLKQLQNIRQRLLLVACEASKRAWERNMQASIFSESHSARMKNARSTLLSVAFAAMTSRERAAVLRWSTRFKLEKALKQMQAETTSKLRQQEVQKTKQQQISALNRIKKTMNRRVAAEMHNQKAISVRHWKKQCSITKYTRSSGLVGRSGWSILRLCVAGSAPRKHVHNWR